MATEKMLETAVRSDPSPRSSDRTSSAQATLSGALVALVTSLLAASADLASALLGDLPGSGVEVALSIASLLVVLLTPAGALLGLWLLALRQRAMRRGPATSEWRKWLFASTSGLPLLAGVWWVPWSWLSENAAALSPKESALLAGVYAGLLLAVLIACRVAWWCYDVYLASPVRLPRAHWPLFGFALLLAAACYWADLQLFVDLYEDLHYGLAGTFVVSLGVAVVAGRAVVRRARPRLLERLTSPNRYVLGTWALLLGGCLLVQFSRLSGTRAARALVHSKATLTVLRYSDFDADGYSALFGGLDCAPFNGLRSPEQIDLPNNGADEDCTGSDARWPKPKPATAYPIPDARGFNLLLITVDTLRADRMSAFGHTRKTTPQLEHLAGQGLAFSRAYSQGTKTFESLPSLLTGLYPANLPRNFRHRRVRGRKGYMYTLTEDGVTITQLLAERGYQTRAILSLDWLSALGLDRGFDRLESSPKQISGKARKYLRGAQQPFFLWLHYAEPHSSYTRHPEYDFGASDLDRYDSEVAYVDMLIGQVLEELKQNGLADKTIVVLTADHGEEFREHGGQYHGNKLHRELLHVPLIIKVPGVKPARVDDLVELTDVAPSLCEALQLRPSCADFDGQSLWATRAGQRDRGPGYRGAYSEAMMRDGVLQRRSLLTEQFRLNLNLDAETIELFDVVRDPAEQKDISGTHPDQVRALRDEMALRPYRRLATPFETVAKSDSSELLRALPLLRSAPLLQKAVEAIAKYPSPGSRAALEQLKRRPGLGDNVRLTLDDVLAQTSP